MGSKNHVPRIIDEAKRFWGNIWKKHIKSYKTKKNNNNNNNNKTLTDSAK